MAFPKKMDITKYKDRIENEFRYALGDRATTMFLAHLSGIFIGIMLSVIAAHHGS